MGRPRKYYTISTMIFKSKAEAEAQILEFEKEGGMRKGTKIIEVAKVFDVSVEKVAKTKEIKVDEAFEPLF